MSAPTLARRVQATTASNLLWAVWFYVAAWLSSKVLLPLLVHHGWLAPPVIYLQDAAR